jgi:hypothetical protein
VREQGALHKLPAGDREGWQQLWMDVDDERATAYGRLGVELAQAGRLAEAVEVQKKGVAMRGDLVARFPTRPGYRIAYATSRGNLALPLAPDAGSPTPNRLSGMP